MGIERLVERNSEMINRRCAAMLRNTSCNKDASKLQCATPKDRDLLMKIIKALAPAKDLDTQLDITVALSNYCTEYGIDALEVSKMSGQSEKLEDGSVSALLSLMDSDKDKD